MRSADWIASEQARYHALDLTIRLALAGELRPDELRGHLLVYGRACCRRAADLAREAATARARSRARAESR